MHTWFYHFTHIRLNKKLSAIKMGYHKSEATQGLGQRQSMIKEQVITFPLEFRMILELEYKHKVPCLYVGLHIHQKIISYIQSPISANYYFANIVTLRGPKAENAETGNNLQLFHPKIWASNTRLIKRIDYLLVRQC